jgi:1-acyl-sn-glycerol-3-phosphate acyltransferase
MLEACPNPWVLRWFNWYCRYALRKHFHSIHVDGNLSADNARGRLYVANHSNFWDGLLLNFLLRPLGQPLFCMIEETQVRKHPFFRRVGGFSISRTNPRSAVRSLDYAAGLLNSGAAVILFPQGKLEPSDQRPLVLERGVIKLLEKAPECAVVPMALLYEFGQEQRPEILIRIGSEQSAGEFTATGGLDRLQGQITELLDDLRSKYLSSQIPGRLALAGRPSISQWRGPWVGE